MPNDFLEKSLEDIIFENRRTIHRKGLPEFKRHSFQQFKLLSGKEIDIITYNLNRGVVNVDIYELKKDIVDTATVCQVYNYMHEFMGLVGAFFPVINARIIVVGKTYVPISILSCVNIPIEIYTYDYTMDGVVFNRQSSECKKFNPNNTFVNALVAFGGFAWHYPDGTPKSISIVSIYLDHLKNEPDFEHKIEAVKKEYLAPYEQKLLPPADFCYPHIEDSPTTPLTHVSGVDKTSYEKCYFDNEECLPTDE